MKTLITILFFAMLAVISCKKSNDQSNPPVTVQKGISYPDSIYYGKNILSYPDSAILSDGTNYEMGALLEKDASLYLIITNYPVTNILTGHTTEWFYSSQAGWNINNYDMINNTQKFISSQTGKIDLEMIFSAYGETGKCKIDFYENGNAITRVKHFSWQ